MYRCFIYILSLSFMPLQAMESSFMSQSDDSHEPSHIEAKNLQLPAPLSPKKLTKQQQNIIKYYQNVERPSLLKRLSLSSKEKNLKDTFWDLKAIIAKHVFDIAQISPSPQIYAQFPLYTPEIIPLCLIKIEELKKEYPLEAAHLLYRTRILITYLEAEHPEKNQFLKKITELNYNLPKMIVKEDEIMFKSTTSFNSV